MANGMTIDEMAQAYPALCQRCEDLRSDLEETRELVNRLREERETWARDRAAYEQKIMALKAKLYDLTTGTYL